jgi:hypothetical protein
MNLVAFLNHQEGQKAQKARIEPSDGSDLSELLVTLERNFGYDPLRLTKLIKIDRYYSITIFSKFFFNITSKMQ